MEFSFRYLQTQAFTPVLNDGVNAIVNIPSWGICGMKALPSHFATDFVFTAIDLFYRAANHQVD
jgi:hypothetical protein